MALEVSHWNGLKATWQKENNIQQQMEWYLLVNPSNMEYPRGQYLDPYYFSYTQMILQKHWTMITN